MVTPCERKAGNIGPSDDCPEIALSVRNLLTILNATLEIVTMFSKRGKINILSCTSTAPSISGVRGASARTSEAGTSLRSTKYGGKKDAVVPHI